MSAEDQAMMARITELAGRINRHKNQQSGLASAHASQHAHNHRTSNAPSHTGRSRVDSPQDTGYSSNWRRGSGYPYRGHHNARPVHRHRTLVLNGNSQNKPAEADSSGTSDASSSSWVTKTDRHLQLINSAVFEKDAQARVRAIEQTNQQKRLMKDERERAKLMSHLHRMANNGAMAPPGQPSTNKHEIVIQGIRFVVAKNGSKLVKVPGASKASRLDAATGAGSHTFTDPANWAETTPKMAVVAGVRFYRSKNGNLYRHGIVKAQRYVTRNRWGGPLTPTSGRTSRVVKKIDEPCKKFSLTGSCLKGPRCRYIHDPEKVAACKDYLRQGECPNGDDCDLSHDLTSERTPACLHFAKDSCTNPYCRYAHVKVSPGMPVCRAFVFYGYCEKGADCPDRHAFECPDFSNTGVCKSKGCKFPHRERAGALRKASGAREAMADEEMEDLSSDEDGSVDSNDVDSDEVDEFLGQDGAGDGDLMEKDYIEL
ncbi:hypothetical protein B0T16DRAFT_400307 [Cercophora newfieldiana]|uniref:C3H1-type domain-containing protein n=1 Tax=Cercophora newfieldiana TaxID=92897 RepID=A0AA39YQK5_9PEZI|nr:hypothetical protein B0T16DRAFT_400307 [Cercophora newfieldiana]